MGWRWHFYFIYLFDLKAAFFCLNAIPGTVREFWAEDWGSKLPGEVDKMETQSETGRKKKANRRDMKLKRLETAHLCHLQWLSKLVWHRINHQPTPANEHKPCANPGYLKHAHACQSGLFLLLIYGRKDRILCYQEGGMGGKWQLGAGASSVMSRHRCSWSKLQKTWLRPNNQPFPVRQKYSK